MSFSFLTRRIHRWGAIAVGLPLMLVIGSGLLLQVKKQVTWVQPPEQRTTSVPAVALPQLLAVAQSVPQAGVRTWDDIDRIDVRPGKGILKIVAVSRWEIQVSWRSAWVASR